MSERINIVSFNRFKEKVTTNEDLSRRFIRCEHDYFIHEVNEKSNLLTRTKILQKAIHIKGFIASLPLPSS